MAGGGHGSGRWLLLACALLFLLAGPAAARIVAVGDLHGDHSAWTAIARAAGLIDARGRWAGRTTTLVQMGDVADRGPDTRKIVRELIRLQREAAASGGRVIVLVGNHEAMNMTGDLRYVTPEEFAAFADRRSDHRRAAFYAANSRAIEARHREREPAATAAAIRAAWMAQTPLGLIEHRRAWAPTGEIGRWVVANPAVLLLEGTLFVHAGLSPDYAARPLAAINRAVAAALAAGETDERSILHDPLGPLWYRGLAAPDLPAAALEALLGATGAGRVVVAHTPQTGGIAIRHGGRLALIDTGISAFYGGQPSWLEIVDGRLAAHRVARP